MAALLGLAQPAAPATQSPRVASLTLSKFLSTIDLFMTTPETPEYEQELEDAFEQLKPTLRKANPLDVAPPNEKHT